MILHSYQSRALLNTVMNLWVLWKVGNFWTSWATVSFWRRTLLHVVSVYNPYTLLHGCALRPHYSWHTAGLSVISKWTEVEVKLFLCLTKYHTMKTVGKRRSSSKHSWFRHYAEVSGDLHSLAASLRWKEPSVCIEQKAGWTPEPALTRKGREKISSLTLPGIEIRSFSP